MNKKEIIAISNKLEILIGQPLNYIGRGGGSVFVGFGDEIEKSCFTINDNGEMVKNDKKLVSRYSLHIECVSRFTCGDNVVLAKCDMYNPTTKAFKELDFDWETFEWDIFGENKFDEIAQDVFLSSIKDFTVTKIKVNNIGDVKIYFTNDFILEILIDTSIDDECWRFFETGAREHLVVSSWGIME